MNNLQILSTGRKQIRTRFQQHVQVVVVAVVVVVVVMVVVVVE